MHFASNILVQFSIIHESVYSNEFSTFFIRSYKFQVPIIQTLRVIKYDM